MRIASASAGGNILEMIVLTCLIAGVDIPAQRKEGGIISIDCCSIKLNK